MSRATIWRRADGRVRAPWQLAVFGILVFGVALLAGGIAYELLLATPVVAWSRLAHLPLDHLMSAACVVGATALTGRIFRPGDLWSFIGMDRKSWSGRGLAIATVAALTVLLVPVAAMVLAGVMGFEPFAATDSGLLSLWAAIALFVPAALTEELLFRGFAFSVVRESAGTVTAVAITSIFFGLVHLNNPGPTVVSTGAVMVAGVFLAIIRIVTGSLVAATLAHLVFNFTQAAILHAPVSGTALQTPGYRLTVSGPDWLTGGAWGPEGGVAVVLAMICTSFLLLKYRPQRLS